MAHEGLCTVAHIPVSLKDSEHDAVAISPCLPGKLQHCTILRSVGVLGGAGAAL